MPSPPAIPPNPIAPDLIKEIAMDIGKEIAAYIERMYPEAVKAASSTFLLSVRNSIYNEIMAALETTDENAIRNRLARRKSERRQLRAMWKRIRETDWEKVRSSRMPNEPPAAHAPAVNRNGRQRRAGLQRGPTTRGPALVGAMHRDGNEG